MIQWWRKRRNLKRIARRLPLELARRFGATSHYTGDQVRTVLRERRYHAHYWNYALAMCLAAEHAAAELGGAEAVADLRTEIADRYFHGDARFSMEIARLDAGSATSHGHGHGHDGSGGGFSDGGGYGDGGSL